jgi:predicted nucleic acid-binding Zn ribbon protein
VIGGLGLTESEKSAKKPYIYPHRHCLYCGRIIEVKGRDYCLKCKPEYVKEQSKIKRSKRFQRYLLYYIIAVFAILVLVALFT